MLSVGDMEAFGTSGVKISALVPGQKHTPVILLPATARLVWLTLSSWECFPHSFASGVIIAAFPVLPLSHLCAGLSLKDLFYGQAIFKKRKWKISLQAAEREKLSGRLLNGSSSLRHKCCAIFSYDLWFNSTPSFSSPLKAVGSATAPY